MNGGCETCNHSWGETKCKGCLWDGKLQRNTHWEPFINKPCVSEQACREDKMKVLEKIKAEIETESAKSFKYPNWERAKALEWALDVIDKYMAESGE